MNRQMNVIKLITIITIIIQAAAAFNLALFTDDTYIYVTET
jgi:hypothetical protein